MPAVAVPSEATVSTSTVIVSSLGIDSETTKGRLVVPVFPSVTPSDIAETTGGSSMFLMVTNERQYWIVP